jgi:DNA helicase-2/ATP-dependent DNA helicase PcrA
LEFILDLLAGLNEPQRQAVTHVDGPLLVLAGAGSGKTRVITRRIAYLVQQGVAPYNVLGLTFTNKAAGEMRERVEQLGTPRGTTVSTFHALGARLLREFAEEAGLKRSFTIYDRADQLKLTKEAMEIAEVPADRLSPSRVHAAISSAKNDLMTSAGYTEQAGDFYSRQVAKVFEQYQRLLGARSAVDFDDLLLKMAFLFRDRPDIREHLGKRYAYILIDEYQDTNRAQYIIAHGMAMEHQNICATGDPDQSIYEWRGADIGNIMEFEQDYPNAVVVRLEENYRSTAPILATASTLIAHNKMRKEKSLWTRRVGGADVSVLICRDGEAEANEVAARIKKYVAGGGSYGNVAVFYRVNSLSRQLEEAFIDAAIPYRIARGVEFYNRKEIKDVLGYLKLMVNPADDLACQRIINTPPRGIGDATIKKLSVYAFGRGMSMLDACRQADQAGLSAATARKVQAFADLVTALSSQLSPDVRTIMEQVVKVTGIEKSLKQEEEEGNQPLANVYELISTAARFDQREGGSLADYLQVISLVSDVDHFEDNENRGRYPIPAPLAASPPEGISPGLGLFPNQEEGNRVASPIFAVVPGGGQAPSVRTEPVPPSGAVMLMTLHAAKGLEFNKVFVIGCEEGLLPFERGDEMQSRTDSTKAMEEERRLAFVGMTRARDELTLSCVRYRMIRGRTTPQAGSRFLCEMGKESVKLEDLAVEDDMLRPRGRGGFAPQPRRGGYYEDSDDRALIESMADVPHPDSTDSDGQASRPLPDPQASGFGGGAGQGAASKDGSLLEESMDFPPEYEHLRVGSRVRSPKFGPGKIVKIGSQPWPQTRVEVFFEASGPKTLVLALARLDVDY